MDPLGSNSNTPIEPTSHSNVGVTLYKICDWIPGVSTISNLFTLCIFKPIASSSSSLKDSHFLTHVNDKSILECILLSIPVLGQVIYLLILMFKKETPSLIPPPKPLPVTDSGTTDQPTTGTNTPPLNPPPPAIKSPSTTDMTVTVDPALSNSQTSVPPPSSSTSPTGSRSGTPPLDALKHQTFVTDPNPSDSTSTVADRTTTTTGNTPSTTTTVETPKSSTPPATALSNPWTTKFTPQQKDDMLLMSRTLRAQGQHDLADRWFNLAMAAAELGHIEATFVLFKNELYHMVTNPASLNSSAAKIRLSQFVADLIPKRDQLEEFEAMYSVYLESIHNDPQAAFEIAYLSAKMGNFYSMCRLAECYIYSIGTPKDKEKAMNLLLEAAKTSPANASEIYVRGMASLELPLTPPFTTNPNLTKEQEECGVASILAAASASHVEALHILALFYQHGLYGIEKNIPNAIEILTDLAVNTGDPEILAELEAIRPIETTAAAAKSFSDPQSPDYSSKNGLTTYTTKFDIMNQRPDPMLRKYGISSRTGKDAPAKRQT